MNLLKKAYYKSHITLVLSGLLNRVQKQGGAKATWKRMQKLGYLRQDPALAAYFVKKTLPMLTVVSKYNGMATNVLMRQMLMAAGDNAALMEKVVVESLKTLPNMGYWNQRAYLSAINALSWMVSDKKLSEKVIVGVLCSMPKVAPHMGKTDELGMPPDWSLALKNIANLAERKKLANFFNNTAAVVLPALHHVDVKMAEKLYKTVQKFDDSSF